MGDLEVRGTHELDVRASSYELTCTLEWAAADAANDIGLEVCRAPGGGRFVSAGIEPPAARAYLDRTRTVNPGGGRTHAPLEHTAARVSLRLLVDRTSVELFVDEGRSAQSHRVFPLAGDDRIHFYARGGGAPCSATWPSASSRWSPRRCRG